MCKKIFCCIICALCLGAAFPERAEAASLSGISAQGFVVMDAATDTVLYEHNAQKIMSMASTTKIMTGLLALERLNPDEIVTIREEMVMVEGTSMGLLPGDALSVRGILTGLLLASGNDAANTLAIHMAGSLPDFALLMNQKAREIGMKNTSFVTPSGLDHDNHYTTACDMALLASYAMKNPTFEDIVSSKKEKVVFQNPSKTVTYANHNRLLSTVDGAVGVKTGFTQKSGRCLVSAARRNGALLVAVTLKASSDWDDHKKLYEYGFTQVGEVPLDTSIPKSLAVVASSKTEITLKTARTPTTVLPLTNNKIERKIQLPRFVFADITEGDPLGEIQYYCAGRLIHTEPILAAESAVIAVRELTFWEKVKEKIRNIFRRKR